MFKLYKLCKNPCCRRARPGRWTYEEFVCKTRQDFMRTMSFKLLPIEWTIPGLHTFSSSIGGFIMLSSFTVFVENVFRVFLMFFSVSMTPIRAFIISRTWRQFALVSQHVHVHSSKKADVMNSVINLHKFLYWLAKYQADLWFEVITVICVIQPRWHHAI